MTLAELSPFIVAGIVIMNGWLVWRATEGKKDRESIRVEQNEIKHDLSTFKEKSAREHVTQDMLARVEGKIVSAIERIGDRLDRVMDKSRNGD